MINFVVFSSKSFMPRTQVCIDSIREFYRLDQAVIHFVEYQSDNPGNYVEGMAKARLEKCKELLEQGYENVLLLGADCVLYNKIDVLLETEGDIVLVPHVIEPPKNNAAGFYKTGHANADVVLFRNKFALDALNWILSQPIIDDSSNGIFYEQTYLSALPFLDSGSDIGICFEKGINYAYFNIHERTLTNGSPIDKILWIEYGGHLRLAQFSGYVDGNPDQISKYYSGPKDPIVLELFRDYQKRIDNAKIALSNNK